MSLRKLTAGDGYSYLTRQVAAHDSTEKGHTGLGDYYAEKGESPGHWMGAGLAGLDMNTGAPVTAEQMKALFGRGLHPDAVAIEQRLVEAEATTTEVKSATHLGQEFRIHSAQSPFKVRVAQAFTEFNTERGLRWSAMIAPEVRARIRTEIGTTIFTEDHGRGPLDARELSGFIAKGSRQPTSAIAGFDLTFSPVKSVSTLWALAPREVADSVRAAHDAAVTETLAWLEREVAYTRLGRGGARQVKVRGLVAAAFTHRDSRAGDPDLHTHVAVSNKVQTTDRRWLALDARVLYAAKVAASEHYNTRLEAELVERLGVEFTERDDTIGARVPVREIRGISTTLTRWWSRRRIAIETRQSELAASFQDRYGRPPTAIEAKSLADQATLETRDAKHGHRSEREQRDLWRTEADNVMGGAAEVEEMLARVTGRARTGMVLTREWVEAAADATIISVEESRATWNVWHLLAEAQRQTRQGSIARDDAKHAVDQVVDAAISRSVRLGVDDPVAEPPQLTRPDGASVYDIHGATRFTSARVLKAEEDLLTLASRTGAHALSEVRVEVAIAASGATGFDLNDAQAAMVRGLATSGAVVQLALAPAGTGKTTTMSVLAEAWTAGGGRVIGLAPSARAAHELSQSLPGHTDTLAKLTWTLANAPSAEWPRWIREIGPQSLVIIDEAGQASTTELAAAARYVAARGGAVRLVGDDQQLAAVGAGGTLRDIQHQHGATTLTEILRFHDPAEAAATLAVREGDTSALGFYADDARIHVGDLGTVADQAYNAWTTDRHAGLDSVLLAPTRDLVAKLNAKAQADRLTRSTSERRGEADLADGNRACAGDIIITRRNNRRLMISGSNWVKNGDRWHVDDVHPDGSLTARHLNLGRTAKLPAAYVTEHVQLGYATTVHGAQGMTADTSHLVATGEENRQTLYVGISRGRQANHLYLATGFDGDPHSLIDPKALRPPTAIDILTEVLQRDGSDRSATTTQREASSSTTQLHQSVTRYHDALGFAAEKTLGVEALSDVDACVEAIWPGLTTEAAYPALRAHLSLRALDGADPTALLLDAAGTRELSTSHDRTAVLDWRLGSPTTTGPLPWLDAVPERLAEHPTWGPYLQGRSSRIATVVENVRVEAMAWSVAASPSWATGLASDEYAELRADLSVWRAAFAVPDDDHRPTGPQQPGSSTAPHQRHLDRRAKKVLGIHAVSDGLVELMPEEVCSDRGFGRLSERLGALEAAQIDVVSLITRALEVDHPLPDEHPADALWWRIARHIDPAALRAPANHTHTRRPDWTPPLCERLGQPLGEKVLADEMWPTLVAAIHARPPEWTAEQLLDAAIVGPGPDKQPENLCSALVSRIATVTDASFAEAEPLQAEEGPVENADHGRTHPVAEPSTAAERILELNAWARDHYSSLYPKSWAPDYLAHRLGNDLSHDARFEVGYAPPGPSNLIRHLCARGATVEELLDAGLARTTDHGRLTDAFRDRLIFPIQDEDGVIGFVGRRNPTKDHHQFAGPKYLNTRATAAFAKGSQLFGLSEGSTELQMGATPVLVEGPLDAIAITIGTDGTYIGVAPLGTAFTEVQAEKLRPYIRRNPDQLIIATDPDQAGWQSAQRAFWRLAALRATPRHLALPDGVDPADFLRTQGTDELLQRLEPARDFADLLLTRGITEGDPLDADALTRADLCRRAARLIGALPPDRWLQQADLVAERLDLSHAAVYEEVIEAGTLWSDTPATCAAREIASVRSGPNSAISRIPDLVTRAITGAATNPTPTRSRRQPAPDR